MITSILIILSISGAITTPSKDIRGRPRSKPIKLGSSPPLETLERDSPRFQPPASESDASATDATAKDVTLPLDSMDEVKSVCDAEDIKEILSSKDRLSMIDRLRKIGNLPQYEIGIKEYEAVCVEAARMLFEALYGSDPATIAEIENFMQRPIWVQERDDKPGDGKAYKWKRISGNNLIYWLTVDPGWAGFQPNWYWMAYAKLAQDLLHLDLEKRDNTIIRYVDATPENFEFIGESKENPDSLNPFNSATRGRAVSYTTTGRTAKAPGTQRGRSQTTTTVPFHREPRQQEEGDHEKSREKLSHNTDTGNDSAEISSKRATESAASAQAGVHEEVHSQALDEAQSSPAVQKTGADELPYEQTAAAWNQNWLDRTLRKIMEDTEKQSPTDVRGDEGTGHQKRK